MFKIERSGHSLKPQFQEFCSPWRKKRDEKAEKQLQAANTQAMAKAELVRERAATIAAAASRARSLPSSSSLHKDTSGRGSGGGGMSYTEMEEGGVGKRVRGGDRPLLQLERDGSLSSSTASRRLEASVSSGTGGIGGRNSRKRSSSGGGGGGSAGYIQVGADGSSPALSLFRPALGGSRGCGAEVAADRKEEEEEGEEARRQQHQSSREALLSAAHSQSTVAGVVPDSIARTAADNPNPTNSNGCTSAVNCGITSDGNSNGDGDGGSAKHVSLPSWTYSDDIAREEEMAFAAAAAAAASGLPGLLREEEMERAHEIFCGGEQLDFRCFLTGIGVLRSVWGSAVQ